LQSLFRLHVPPRSNFWWLLLQAARAQAKQIQVATRTVFIAFSFWDRNSLLGTGLAIAAQCRQIDFLGFVQHAVQALATDAQGLRRALYVAAGRAQGRERRCDVGVSNIGARDRRRGRG
jgi:predicted phage tail protein